MKSLPVKILIGALIMALVGPLSINMQGYTPITLQSLAVILVPILFGWKAGLASVLIYLGLGAFGLPVFANFSGGLSALTGDTAGFLWAFIPVSFVAGFYGNRIALTFGKFFLLFLVCHALLLLAGLGWQLIVGVSGSSVFSTLKYLFPAMLLKSFVGGFLVLAVKKEKDPI